MPNSHPEMDRIGFKNLKQAIDVGGVTQDELRHVLHEKSITWKAKALLLFIATNKDFFSDVTTDKNEALYRFSAEGITAVQSGIKELQNLGWLRKRIIRNGNNQYIIGSIWKIGPEEVSS